MTEAVLEECTTVESKADNSRDKGVRCSILKCSSARFMQITAPILFAIGICAIGTMIFMAIWQKTNKPENVIFHIDNDSLGAFLHLAKSSSRRLVYELPYNFNDSSEVGCEETSCKLRCSQVENIYEAVYETLTLSECTTFDVLLIDTQPFPLGVLSNSWVAEKRPIRELFLSSSYIQQIKNGAFNSPMFSLTFLLTWHKLNLRKVGIGALLGLHSLRYLIIDTPMDKLSCAFFQPVQTTLTHLKLNAGLTMGKDVPIFCTNRLKKLEYIDFSGNYLREPLCRDMFRSTPNLKYLILQNAEVSAIEVDAFDYLLGKLQLLDLSENRITRINGATITPLLSTSGKPLINLADNDWVCDCEVISFVKTYTTYRGQFMHAIYCKAPHSVYGTFIDELDLTQLGCEQMGMLNDTDKTLVGDTTTYKPSEKDSEGDTLFQLRCMNVPDSNASIPKLELLEHTTQSTLSDSAYSGSEVVMPVTATYDEPVNSVGRNQRSNLDNMSVEPPCHEFELLLFKENLTVRVSIDGCLYNYFLSSTVSIIWFTDDINTLLDENTFQNCVHFDCSRNSSIIVGPLTESKTYTFCLLPDMQTTITPFNCLPLYVPAKIHSEDNIWIIEEKKPFTVGMLCLVFLLSAFTGAVLAYFGIKSHPDLLEGSKNVLVIKKSDKTCYVSTISESQYMRNNVRIKKRAKGDSMKKQPSKNIPMKLNIVSSNQFDTSAANVDFVCSSKSSSTCFEEAFFPVSVFNDEYELPMVFEKNANHACEQHCVPNNYASSPRVPPPLPKRNSTNSDERNEAY